jgi:hypothetical protein
MTDLAKDIEHDTFNEVVFDNGRFLRSADEDSIGEVHRLRPTKQGRASKSADE